jgi:ABC-2 type transport system permease protein
VSSEKLKQFLSPVELNITQWLNGVGKKNEEGQFAVIFVLEFAMYIVTLMYGMNVLRSVITEKTSRILEVLLSSLTPSELMSGKIFGVGAAGLTQVAIWALTATVLSSPMAVMLASVVGQSTFNPAIAACFIAFFLLGFLLYSSLCAAVGSMVSAEQEAQQFQFLITAPMMLSFFFVFFAIRAPNDPLVVALSMFPFSAPIVMFARIVLGAASKSQIGISIAVMVATIAFVIWLCGRIYRVGVLMYGKRPTLPEILKWIRYA